MTPVIILLNGPRRSGKDTAADAIVRGHPGACKMPIADAIKKATLAYHTLDPAMLDFYESIKDQPLDDFIGLSWRDLVIAHGEQQRENEGPHYWAEAWAPDAGALFEIGIDTIVMSDCRFVAELEAAKELTPHVLLLRTYRTKGLHHDKGAWNGDIGSWLFPDVADCAQASLINDGQIADLQFEAFTIAHHFIKSVQKRHAAAAV